MKRSMFNLSYHKLLSGNMGELLPIGCTEVLPGDTFSHGASVFLRTAPLVAPVMHPVHVRVHHFFVPLRLLWEDWESFITGGPDGQDASVVPTVELDTDDPADGGVGSLADYLGFPVNQATIEGSALPLRAYALIWNEWFRDQDLQNELVISLAGGTDTTTNRALQACAWEKDYFTSARPWVSKGADVTLPIGGSAPILASGNPVVNGLDGVQYYDGSAWQDTGLTANNTSDVFVTDTMPNALNPLRIGGGIGGGNAYVKGSGANSLESFLTADLSNATAVQINDLRRALAIQRYQENRARYGSRYTEYLRMMGVQSPDERLQRPELLASGKQTIQFSEVLQTGVDSSDEGVGNMKGHGIAAMKSNSYRRYFPEHGLVLTLLSARPKTMYTQGVQRMWNRLTKEDYFQPELQHIGQQAIQAKEIYAGAGNGTWGYQDRYDEYRRMESTVAGEFRTTVLNFWHMARIFGSSPSLNADFVKCTPTNRIYQATSADQLYIFAKHNLKAARLLSREGRSFIL